MAEIEYSSAAVEWLQKADPDAKEQVVKKIEEASGFPDHFLDRLRGSPLYKLRAGDYRILINWRKDDGVLVVREIGKRDGFYE